MNSSNTRRRRYAGATMLALITGLLFAPQASAEVDDVNPPAEVAGFPCVVRCSVTAHLSGADAHDPVTFSVDGRTIGTATPTGDQGKVTATIEWAAPSNGRFVITAAQASGDKTYTYTVDVDASKAQTKS